MTSKPEIHQGENFPKYPKGFFETENSDQLQGYDGERYQYKDETYYTYKYEKDGYLFSRTIIFGEDGSIKREIRSCDYKLRDVGNGSFEERELVKERLILPNEEKYYREEESQEEFVRVVYTITSDELMLSMGTLLKEEERIGFPNVLARARSTPLSDEDQQRSIGVVFYPHDMFPWDNEGNDKYYQAWLQKLAPVVVGKNVVLKPVDTDKMGIKGQAVHSDKTLESISKWD